jgi:hypothetical protein
MCWVVLGLGVGASIWALLWVILEPSPLILVVKGRDRFVPDRSRAAILSEEDEPTLYEQGGDR